MDTSKAELHGIRAEERSAAGSLWFWLVLGGGFLIRLFFMGNEGFKNDVQSFEAWAITLTQHPFSQFYTSTSFADYPPGYFYVLWVVGHLYALLAPHGNLELLKYLVKLPAVLMDLVDGALIYAIVRRFAGDRWALGATALFVLNPAMIFISAAWGQVDSISSGLALLGIYLLLTCDDGGAPRTRIALAWVALSYSLLIKPQAAVLIPLFLIFALVRKDRLQARIAGTGIGIAAALLFGLLLTLPFHPTANPLDAYGWLLGKYTFAKNVYAYNSVNAFNLWSVLHGFWEPDSQKIGFLPQYVWGVALVVAAVILTAVRYWQARTEQALLESAALVTLAFFMLATRMHERYIYDGLTFTIVCLPFARRYLLAALIFTVTLLVNLFYSLQYLSVVSGGSAPGVDPRDMWPLVTHPFSVVNVLTFFILGYFFLGQDTQEASLDRFAMTSSGAGTKSGYRSAAVPIRLSKARAWFNPAEGLASMAWPLDYLLAGLFGAVSFVVSYVNYWLPNEKVFDEIYFARAAEEYLTGKYIYENTHPPLTKLIITLSTMLFGGMPHGDNPAGWRFLDVVFGAVAVVIIYAFAKRLTRSTLFSSFAAIMFAADGMHFVQSRIATPEGIVIVFSLGALYAFYRFWIASQSTVRKSEPGSLKRAGISAGAAAILGCVSGFLTDYFGNPPHQADTAGFIVASVYFAFGWYLVMRLWVVPRFMPPSGEFISYAEGTRITRADGALEIEPPYLRPFKKDLTVQEEAASITYRRDGSVSYATPEGTATYTPGMVADDRGDSQNGRHATTWLVVFTLLLGALVASKWYGVMAYGVSFTVVGFVWLQRYWAEGRAKRWGNPYGFRLDVALAAIVFISMSVYVCAWIPDLVRHVNPGDTGSANVSELVYRQYTMFEYHDKLKATHPYESEWWQWPLDLRPIAYYWKDTRTGNAAANPNACCVSEIISLPNPLILWFGLLCVPIVAVLAWYEKNKGYALLVLAYLLQWLPWSQSPRITFAYHFYVDIPLVVLCNVIVLQRLWNWFAEDREKRRFARIAVGAYVAAVVLAFVWFYPILSATPLPWNQWDARMWLGSHWI